ncbi:MAG: hypothetical protein AAFY88_02835, partial [Acidobacteriota bacterium]
MSSERRKTLGRALMEALELEGDALREYVADFAQRHPSMVEELEGMLAIEDMATDFLAGSAVAEVGMPEPAWLESLDQGRELTADSAADLAADVDADGERWIGPYRLIELLGSGGMGEVYLAEQLEPLERRVALKLVRGTVLGEMPQLRLAAERAMLQRLEHPNIARILDAGTTDGGRAFFA